MISFRYHIVSLVAVFLALAVGIVVGTTALNGPVTSNLRHQVDDLKKERTQSAQQAQSLQGQVNSAEQFASTFGARLVSGLLKGDKVLLVAMPGVSTGLVDDIGTQLTAAGASVTGKLEFSTTYVDPSQGSSITSLATNGSYGVTLPVTNDAGQIGAALLAYVLTGQAQASSLSSALAGFAGLHMINSNPQSIEPAGNVVIVGTGSQSSYGGQSELDLVNAFATDKAKVVVAGDSASAGSTGLVGLTRAGTAKSTVSTVDDADNAVGQVSTTLAMAAALKGQVGQYGTQKGAEALFPTPTS